MKKTTKIIMISLLIILLIGIIVVKTLFNKPIDNPDGTVGNHGGNLNNGGYFCEYGGKVYFANAYDNNALYSMNSDGTDLKKLTKVSVSQINVAGDHVYFYQTGAYSGSDLGSIINGYGIYRCTLDGDNLTCILKNVAGNMLLVNDDIYFQMYNKETGYTFAKISINGGDPIVVEDFIVNPSSANDGMIYYNGTVKNHCLYKLDTSTDISTLLYDGNLWNPVFQDNYVYYMDLNHDYQLCRLNLLNGEKTILSKESVDLFVVGKSYVFFQTRASDDAALKRVNLDGTNELILLKGIYQNLGITSDYVYFNEFGADVPVYRTSATVGTEVETFDAAKNAAMKN